MVERELPFSDERIKDIESSEDNEIPDTSSKWSEDDLRRAHSYSSNHKAVLQNDKLCGCFYCLEIFEPNKITEFLEGDNDCDRNGTAICPHCGIDSVIGESSGFSITKEFLNAMNKAWF